MNKPLKMHHFPLDAMESDCQFKEDNNTLKVFLQGC